MDEVQLKLIYWLLVQILETIQKQGEKMTTFTEGLDSLRAVAADIAANVAKLPTGGGTPTEGAPTAEQLADFQAQIDALSAANADLLSKLGGAGTPPATTVP